MKPLARLTTSLVATGLLALAGGVHAQEAVIRKALGERLPNFPKIDEVRPTPMAGVYEVRFNQSELLYSDAKGDFIFLQGEMFDTAKRLNLTEERINKLTAVSFDQLPLKDAFTTVRGTGKQQIAVFSDPNCGYCKRLERDLLKLNDVTVHTFLVALLGPDSQTKARNIWCSKGKSVSYADWMLNGKPAAAAPAGCDTAALARNQEFAQRQRITGTPTTIMADGTRIQGADFKRIEQVLAASSK